MTTDYEAVIGLEVHAQIHTLTKMFCGCPVKEDTGDLPPNHYVCPVCLALPGALPVVNRRAVEMGILTGLALQCTINPINVFARKSYFYPDLPKGYQISQYELPLASGGMIEIETESGPKRVDITRAHLEEDTAKLYHQDDGRVYVDFNRAGVPLLEIVSEPVMHSVEEVRAYAMALHDVLVYLGVNSGDMQKGMMRFEANVSVRPKGSKILGTRVEIKNLNSFRALTHSTAYEIARQTKLVKAGGAVVQQTMGWDETQERTYPQRSKEYAHDYRYFPEPDIPPLEISRDWVDTIQAQLPELPLAKKRRLVAEYGIRPYDANLLIAEQAIADYFEAAAHRAHEKGIDPQDVANWMTGEFFRLMNESNHPLANVKVTPDDLVALLEMQEQDKISATAAKTVLTEIFTTGEAPKAAVSRLGLMQISDTDALTELVQTVIAQNPKQVQQYLDGKKTVIGWLVGQVMRASRGKANPQQARQLLKKHLERESSG